MTSSQKAVIAVDMLPLLEQEAKERQKLSAEQTNAKLGRTSNETVTQKFGEALDKPKHEGKSTMRRGLSLIGYFIPHAKKAFDCMEANEGIEDARYLWGKLEALSQSEPFQRDCFTKQKVWRVVRGKFKTAEPFDAAIKTLIDRCFIRMVKEQNREAGRNTNLIYLNPMAIMAKITNEPNEKQTIDHNSHYSHVIQQLKNENVQLIEQNPLPESIETVSMDVFI